MLDDFDLDVRYLTDCQVEKRRRDLFLKKAMLQNQMMTLKEKGKRLGKIGVLNEIEDGIKVSLYMNSKELRCQSQNNLK